MTEKEQLQTIFQEFLDLELTRAQAKQCTLITINVMVNHGVKNANQTEYLFWSKVKTLAKEIE